jgi:RNA polymerase sigma factor (sigma-70 family)
MSISEIEDNYEIKDLVARLPEQQRRAIILFAYGLTQKEIGEQMGISQQTVKRLLEKGLKNLRILQNKS